MHTPQHTPVAPYGASVSPSPLYSALPLGRRSKADWAGVGPGDAFKGTLDDHQRLLAQRLFYQAVKQAQTAVAQVTGVSSDKARLPRVKPQLAPCYTTYPAMLAASAAIGLTAYLEYGARVNAELLFQHLQDYLNDPTAYDDADVDSETYKELARLVTHSVQTRLLLADLARHPALAVVEIYRLFAAAQQTLHFRSVADIVNAVILYGDILPDWHALELHAVTRAVFTDVTATCQPYFARLPHTASHQLVEMGIDWVLEVCLCLVPYLPTRRQQHAQGVPQLVGAAPPLPSQGQPATQTAPARIAPLDSPHAPTLREPASVGEQIAALLTAAGQTAASPAGKVLTDFATAVAQAGGQARQYEDLRSDLVEQGLRASGFGASAIQGNPTDGQEVRVRLVLQL